MAYSDGSFRLSEYYESSSPVHQHFLDSNESHASQTTPPKEFRQLPLPPTPTPPSLKSYPSTSSHTSTSSQASHLVPSTASRSLYPSSPLPTHHERPHDRTPSPAFISPGLDEPANLWMPSPSDPVPFARTFSTASSELPYPLPAELEKHLASSSDNHRIPYPSDEPPWPSQSIPYIQDRPVSAGEDQLGKSALTLDGSGRRRRGIAGGRGLKSWWPASKFTKSFVGLTILQTMVVMSIEVSA